MRCFDVLALPRGDVGISCSGSSAQSKADATDDQRDEEQPSANPRCDEHRSYAYREEEAGEEKRRAHEAGDCRLVADPNLDVRA